MSIGIRGAVRAVSEAEELAFGTFIANCSRDIIRIMDRRGAEEQSGLGGEIRREGKGAIALVALR